MNHLRTLISLGFALAVPGCRSLPTLPPANLGAPGWSLRQGQAVWIERNASDGVAGELLLATRTDGACFVQFAKPPFTLVTARAEASGWSMERASGRARTGGRGPAPARDVWFALARATTSPAGNGVDAWCLDELPGGGWRLVHAVTGESLEGYWFP